MIQMVTKPMNLTPAQWKLLQFCRADVAVGMGFPSMPRIAEYMGWINASAPTQVLAALTGLGYIKREWHIPKNKRPGDGRRCKFVYELAP